MMDAKRVLTDVRRITHDVLKGYEVDCYLFGSWATRTQRRSSDIDVAIDAHAPLPPATLSILRERFEESHIPYRVEVVDLSEVDATFRREVIRQGVRWSV